MIRSFVCSVYLLAVCIAHPIQANDECLINDGLMDEIPSLNNQTTINAGSIQVLSDARLELKNGFEIKLEDLNVNGDQAVFNENKKSINEYFEFSNGNANSSYSLVPGLPKNIIAKYQIQFINESELQLILLEDLWP